MKFKTPLEPGDALGVMSTFPIYSVLSAAIKHGILAQFQACDASPADISKARGYNHKTVEILCDCLTELGLLESRGDALHLRPQWRAWLEQWTDVLNQELEYASRWSWIERVMSGDTQRESIEDDMFGSGTGLVDYLIGVRKANETHAKLLCDHLRTKPEVSRCQTLLDLGGGHALYASLMLENFAGMQATVCDMPRTVEVSRWINETSAVRDRLHFVEGDARELPEPDASYDFVFMNDLLHSFDHETKQRVIANAVRRVSPGGLLSVTKYPYSQRGGQLERAFFAMRLNLHTEGRGYLETDEESEALFGDLDLRLLERITLGNPGREKVSYLYERVA